MAVTIIRDCNTAGWAPMYDCRDADRVRAKCRATAPDGSLQPVPTNAFVARANMVLPGEPPDDASILAMIGPTDVDTDVYVFVPYLPFSPPRRFRMYGQFRSDPGNPPRYGIFVAVYP